MRDPRQVPLLQLPGCFDDGRNPSPYSKRKQQNVMFPWDKKKPITRDMQERVMSKLIANGCKKKRRKRTYFSGSAPSDLDLLIREEKRKPGPNHYHVREDSTIARVRVPVMGRLNLSSTVSLKPPVIPPGPGAYETHLINPGLDLDKPVSFPQTGRKSMALDNDVPGPGAYPGLFERPYTPGGRMGPVPNLSRVPRVDGDDGVEPGPGWYSPRLPGTPGGKLVQGARDTIQLLGYPDEPGPGHYESQKAMDYVEARVEIEFRAPHAIDATSIT